MRTSGSIIKTIGGSQVFTVRITDPAEQMVVIFGLKDTEQVIEKFSSQSRGEGWENITKDGDLFSFQLSEAATAQITQGLLVADVKTWYAEGKNRVARLNLCYVKSTYVSQVVKV